MTTSCTACGIQKEDSEFGPAPAKRNGLDSWCRACHSKRAREYRLAHPEKQAAATRKWHLRTKYGISPAEYDARLAAQGGRCALCGAEVHDVRGGRLAVDHSHESGQVRGLLCGPCNTGLGKLGDTVESLSRALNYVRGM